jgi:hypothetical protein
MSQRLEKSMTGPKAQILIPELYNLIECIEKADITKPDHIHLNTPFSEDFYQSLLDNLPEDESYHDFYHPDSTYDGKTSRLRLILEQLPTGLDKKKAEFWKDIRWMVRDEELRRTFAKKFSVAIKERFPEDKYDTIPMELVSYLFRDLGKYKILPHPDTGRKLITVQIYLPCNNTTEDIGTCFHIQQDKTVFKKVDQIPFRRNYGYAFPVTNQSWHSVDTVREGIVRNSLMLVYSLPKGLNIKDTKISLKNKKGEY